MGLSSARGRPCRATSPAPARAQDWFLSNNKRNTNKKPKHEFKWDCLSQVGVPLQKPAWPSRWQACPWGHGSVPGPCEELHGRGGAPPSPLSPKCFAWERACSQSDANLLWLQPWGSAGRWWPPCPGDSLRLLGDAGTHPATSTSQEPGSRRRGRLGTLPPARLPGRDA